MRFPLASWARRTVAHGLLLIRRVEPAAALLEQLVKDDPDDGRSRMLFAWALLRLNRFAEAEAQYRHIIRRQPLGLDPPLNLAESLIAQRKVSEALGILQTQALRQPHNPHVLFLLANAYVEAGQLQDALVTFRRVVNLDPKDDDAWINLSAALNDLGHWEDALAVSRGVLERRKHPVAARNVANALAGLKRWDEAVDACRTTVALDKNSPESRMDLAMTLIESGRLDDGLTILTSLSAEARDPRILSRLSCGHRKAGDLIAAVRYADEALTLDPASLEAHRARGWAGFELREWPRSAMSFRSVLDVDPGDVSAMVGLAASLSAIGDHKSALEWFDRALLEVPTCLDGDAELRDLFEQSRRAC